MTKKQYAILLYGFLFAFVLSFVFEGRVYFQIAQKMNYDTANQHIVAMFCHMLGLLCAAFSIKTYESAKKVMGILIIMCAAITPFFMIENMISGYVIFGIVSFISGSAVACWGSFLKRYIVVKERLRAIADALIISNILMIIAGAIATYVSSMGGFILSLMYLCIALCIISTIDKGDERITSSNSMKSISSGVSIRKMITFFILFIIIITIDSGLMYGVIQTEYQSFDVLISWYWAVPYIIALFIMKYLSHGKVSTIYLNIAISMIAIGFILFRFMEVSVMSYIVVDTFLLAAAGILDLFWSSIVGETIDYFDRPVLILGAGWSANVLGVFIGGVLSQQMMKLGISKSSVTIVALAIVCVTLMILPEMLKYLRMLLKNQMYLNTFIEYSENKKLEIAKIIRPFEKLTGREEEILQHILKGETNKEISEKLSISENTVKTHVRNVLNKYEVSNRTQLISKILQNTRE